MKQIKFLAFFIGCTIFLIYSCGLGKSNIPIDYSLSTEYIKHAHYNNQLYKIRHQPASDSISFANRKKEYDDLIVEIQTSFHLALTTGPGPSTPPQSPDLECCDPRNPPDCQDVDVRCHFHPIDSLRGIISVGQIDLEIFNIENEKIGEIDKKNKKALAGDRIFYPVVWNTRSIPENYIVRMIEKTYSGKSKEYEVKYVNRPKAK